MSSSKRATYASVDNFVDNLDEKDAEVYKKMKAIKAKYADRGSSGKKQESKELRELFADQKKARPKRTKKSEQDRDNIGKYGKDAMKGKSFAQYNKGGMPKKTGYAGGGLCGASNPAARPMKKGK